MSPTPVSPGNRPEARAQPFCHPKELPQRRSDRFVDRRLTVIVLANLHEANVDTIAYDVAAIVDPELYDPEAAADEDDE